MTYATLTKYLKARGRMKLLPEILRELRVQEARAKARAPFKETAKQNRSLIAGWRSIKDGVLTDHSAKQALIDIYQEVTR